MSDRTRTAALVPAADGSPLAELLPPALSPVVLRPSRTAPLAREYRSASVALVGDPAAMPTAVVVQRYARIPWIAVLDEPAVAELAADPGSLGSRALGQAAGVLAPAALTQAVRRLVPGARLVDLARNGAVRTLIADIAIASDARRPDGGLTGAAADLWTFLDARATRLAMRLLARRGYSDRPIHPHHLVPSPWHLWYRDELRPEDRVVDLGCANGAHSLIAARIARHVLGVDIDGAELEHARARSAREGIANVEFRTLDLTDDEALLALGRGGFDVALVLDVLEHLEERERFLAAVRRLLRPDGRLLLAVPHRNTPYKRLRRRLGGFAYSDPDHKVEYSESVLRSELAAAGFEISELERGGYDTPFAGATALLATISMRAYARLSTRRAALTDRHAERATAFRVVARGRLDRAGFGGIACRRMQPLTLDVWSLTVPTGFRISRTTIRYSHHLLVRIGDGANAGWGAAPLYARSPHELPSIVRTRVDPLLASRPQSPSALRSRAASALGAWPDVLCAVDGALWELEAKRAQVAVASLLGGGMFRVAVTEQLFVERPEDAVRRVEAVRGRGTRRLKVKVSGHAKADVRLLEAVRDAAGDELELRIDANRGYSLDRALALAPRLAALGIRRIEEPLCGSFSDLARLRASTGLEVILDESVRTPDDLSMALEEHALDVLNLKLGRLGGITAADRYRRECVDARVGVLLGCAEELGPGMAAILHAATAWRPVETEGLGWLRLGVDLGEPSPEIVDGMVSPAPGAGWGLGIEPRVLRPGAGAPRSLRLVHHSEWDARFRARSWLQRQRQRAASARARAGRALAART